MSITEEFHFDKEGEVVRFPWLRRFFLTIVILLVALLSFGIGRLTGTERAGVSISYEPIPESQPTALSQTTAASVTASSQGTKYYYSHCGNSISEKNKVTFATATLAEVAGYTLAVNCKPK